MALVQKQFGDLVTFSRPSGGGIWNSQKDFEWLGTNVPRFNFDPVSGSALGLLVEPQRTGLLQNSMAPALWGWSGYTLEEAKNVDGSRSAVIFELTSDLAVKTLTFGLTSLGIVSVTTVARPESGQSETSTLLRNATKAINSPTGDYTYATKELTGTALEARSLRDKVEVKYAIRPPEGSAVGDLMRVYIPVTRALQPGEGWYVGLCHVEVGDFATSFIPTTSAQVTRAADNVFIPNGSWRSPTGRLEVDADEGVTVTLETGGIRIAGLGHIRSLKFYPEVV